MAKTQILDYTIYLQDAELVAEIEAQVALGNNGPGEPYPGLMIQLPQGGFGIYMAPDEAATVFADLMGVPPFPVWNVEDTIVPSAGGSIQSPNFKQNGTFPKDVPTFVKDGGWWIFGSDTRFYWVGHVAYQPPATSPAPPDVTEVTEPALIPQRRAIAGFESNQSGDTTNQTVASTTLPISRAATRHIDGMGYGSAINSGSAQTSNYALTPLAARGHWERFGFRVEVAGATEVGIWRCFNASTSNTGFALMVTPSLQLALYKMLPTASLIGTFGQLELGVSYRVDVIFDIDAVADTMQVGVWLNGELVGSGASVPSGLQINRLHQQSQIGKWDSNTTGFVVSFHHWIIAVHPTTRAPSVAAWDAGTPYTTGEFVRTGSALEGPRYRALQNSTGQPPGGNPAFWRRLTDPIDWINGSRVVRLKPSAFGSGHANWTGDVRLLMQRPLDSNNGEGLTSSTSGALVVVDTDLARHVDNLPGCVGWVGMAVNVYAAKGNVANGSVGYKIGAAAAVDDAIAQTTSLGWNGTIYAPSGLSEPIPAGETVQLRHTKAADTSAARCGILHGLVEAIGCFGEEDVPPVGSSAPPAIPPLPEQGGIQNAFVPESPWATGTLALGPIMIKGGTYVGNSLGQDLDFPIPPVLIMIRPLTADTGGEMWYPSLLRGHTAHNTGSLFANGIADVDQDLSFSGGSVDDDQQLGFRVRIAGSNSQSNQTGVTYQYIAFCDPVGRYSRCHILQGTAQNTNLVSALKDPNFLAELAFFWRANHTTTTTDGAYWKGPAHAAAQVTLMNGGTSITPALTFGTGQITVGSSFWDNSQNYAFLGFRRQDGNDHPDESKVMFMGTYTGDGTASRTISLPNNSGLRPMWAVVGALVSSALFQRDPSHTTNTSTNPATGASSATAITAGGVDSFTVGTTLNSNGVVYQYFGFFSPTATAGNGGWGTNGEHVPVPADSLNPPDWQEPEILDPGASSSAPPSAPVEQPDLDDVTVLPNTTLFCLDYSQRIVNRALGRIGVSKQIGDLAIDTTEAAVVARLHLKDDVEATLRLFPWAFATAYQELVLHSGTDDVAVNADWQYAYEAPVDLIMARRISPQSGRRRRYDPAPIVFRLGLDQTDGHLIYCNERASEEVPLVLEYTRRVGCPSYFGDALFREALTWKIASSLAAALSKDAQKAGFCLQAWEAFRGKAEATAANEQQPEQGTTGGDAEWIRGRGQDADWISGRE